MAEYRPDASGLWRTLRRHFPLVRRIALAIGGAMVAGGVCYCLGSHSDSAGTAALGGALIGFFAPALARSGDLPGGQDDDAATGT